MRLIHVSDFKVGVCFIMFSPTEIPRLFTSVKVVQSIDRLFLFLIHGTKIYEIFLVVASSGVNFRLQDNLEFPETTLLFDFFSTSCIIVKEWINSFKLIVIISFH